MRRKAFTLAEVLISMAIVAIIAALTLPSLMRLQKEAGAGSMLAKVQSTVEDAVGRMIAEDPYSSIQDNNTFLSDLKKHLIMAQTPDGWKLKDGTLLSFGAPTGSVPEKAGVAFKDVTVDINGKGLPNVLGVDKFRFTLSTDGYMFPQGCAALLAANRWKPNKGYDIASCENYNPEDCKVVNCSAGEKFDAAKCQCVTDPDYCQVKTCDKGYYFEGAPTCDCVKIDEPDSCVEKTCDDGYHFDEEVCDCVKNPCVTTGCPKCYEYDETTCACVSKVKTCGDGQAFDYETCSCKDIGCQVKACDDGYHFDEAKCDCVKDDFVCVPTDVSCFPIGWDVNLETCTCEFVGCPEGYVQEGQNCVEAPACEEKVCGKNQIFDEALCACVSPKCDPGTVFNEFTGECDPQVTCEEPWVLNATGTGCECGAILMLDGTCCTGGHDCVPDPKDQDYVCTQAEIAAGSADCKADMIKCQNGAVVTEAEGCPADTMPYCCDYSRPWIMGDACMDGNSWTQDCGGSSSSSSGGGTTGDIDYDSAEAEEDVESNDIGEAEEVQIGKNNVQ